MNFCLNKYGEKRFDQEHCNGKETKIRSYYSGSRCFVHKNFSLPATQEEKKDCRSINTWTASLILSITRLRWIVMKVHFSHSQKKTVRIFTHIIDALLLSNCLLFEHIILHYVDIFLSTSLHLVPTIYNNKLQTCSLRSLFARKMKGTGFRVTCLRAGDCKLLILWFASVPTA